MPVGAEREKYQKILWLRESALETDVISKIKELFKWDRDFEFMYASGRHLRSATLQDVENATSWDCSTIRALMGSGCLYVTEGSKDYYDDYSDLSSGDEDHEKVCTIAIKL